VRLIDEPLPGVKVLSPEVYEDSRGFFMESYNRRRFAELGIECDFAQDNHSRSSLGVLRGLHYQLGYAQAKLVRTTRGRVFDVVAQLFAPEGFAHGFLVLSEVAEFQYKCSDFYSMKDERGLPWDDPTIGIEWPTDGVEPILSDRDRGWTTLQETPEDDLPAFRND